MPASDFILVDTPAFHESIHGQLTVGAADAVVVVVRPIATTTVSLSELVAGIKVLDTHHGATPGLRGITEGTFPQRAYLLRLAVGEEGHWHPALGQ